MAHVKLKVKISRKIFFSDETGFAVCKVSVQGSKDTPVIVGSLVDVSEGDFLEVEGEYVEHPKFGKQVKVTSFKQIMPEDKDGMVKYLKGRIKGLGLKSAGKIVDHFGKSTFNILEQEPERLKEVKGIQRKVIQEVKKNFKGNEIIRELTVKLSPYGIGGETIFKIYKEFEDDAFNVLESNPYILIDRVRGVGFKIADTIARGVGIAANDSFRIKAGINFLVTHVEQKNGDLYMEESELLRRCASLLDVTAEEVKPCVDQLVEQSQLVREALRENDRDNDNGNGENNGDETVILSYKNYVIEESIARQLHNLSKGSSELAPMDIDFEHIFKQTSVRLTEEQQGAVISAVNNRITIITGGPGTGKTTIIRAIIESLQKDEKSVLVAAPTGRAAKRVEEATFYQASTIHRMLKIDPETRHFVHNEQNPLKADAVIVDEFSMVDFFIFHALLRAISQHTRLIIIGDKDQLPSVGPGNVLRDIIGSRFFNIIYLNRNFRQTEDSLIIENAYRINNGEELLFKPYSDDLDFVFVRVSSEHQAREKVVRIVEYHKNDFNFNSPDFQVLVPMYRGEAGIDAINFQVQEQFNSGRAAVKKERTVFKQRDKVMQLKNNYEKDIFNGEQGIVADFDKEKNALMVDFDGTRLEYGMGELEELTLSYSVSVHKAQGSEYDMLILVLLPTHAIMLNRELFYTAVTRAKKKLFLVSDPETVRRAVMNASPSQRKTMLPRRLREIFNPGHP
ncbi:MAG: ATP-dependent RecD-like DNA helicase [bacterium]|nr:ATP-dependent RecD-like DNA helicase [bacterium]